MLKKNMAIADKNISVRRNVGKPHEAHLHEHFILHTFTRGLEGLRYRINFLKIETQLNYENYTFQIRNCYKLDKNIWMTY